ncbi:IclR family transcriptional regulator [Kribbella aluminosa]
MVQSRVQSVDRALGLLWAVYRSPGSSLSELASTAELLPSTALRLLATLQRHDLIERDPQSRGYRIGPAAQVLAGGRDPDHQRISDALEPRLRILAERAREQATIGVIDGRSHVHIAYVDGAVTAGHAVILRPPETSRNSNLNATAIGKVLLAFAPPAQAETLIRQLSFDRTARRTITDPDELRRHLTVVRRNGYATSVNENSDDVRGIAAPLRDTTGEVVAALSINGPAGRFPRDRIRELVPLLCHAAEECSRLLGYRT